VGKAMPPSGFEARWRERFQRYANAHDDDASIAGWSSSGLDARFRHFCKVWQGARAGSIWIDAGCGAGTYARRLAEDDLEVYGLDYSLPTIRKARERSPTVRGWSVADVNRLPLRTGTADGLLCFGVMQALGSTDAAVDEMARVLRPGGEVWIDALNRACLPDMLKLFWQRLRNQPAHLRYDSSADLVASMARRGFEDVRVHWVPILPAQLHRLQWLVESPLIRHLFRTVPAFGRLLSHAFVVHARRAAARAT